MSYVNTSQIKAKSVMVIFENIYNHRLHITRSQNYIKVLGYNKWNGS